MYNVLLPYGSRAFGKTITVVNRSEVVGRPLAALLANDGARVFSVDLDGIQEFSKRKAPPEGSTRPSYHPHHVAQKTELTLEQCLAISDVVVSGVSHSSPTLATHTHAFLSRFRAQLTKSKRTSSRMASSRSTLARARTLSSPSRKRSVPALYLESSQLIISSQASLYCPGIGKGTIAMLQRNLLRLRDYQDTLAATAA